MIVLTVSECSSAIKRPTLQHDDFQKGGMRSGPRDREAAMGGEGRGGGGGMHVQ